MTKPLLMFVGFVSICQFIGAQQVPPSDPRALSIAAQSIVAIRGTVAINDAKFDGTATWLGQERGAVALSALGTGESRVDLAESSGTRTEIRDIQTGIPLGAWTAPENLSGKFAYQNCWTDAVWFFPALGALAGGSNVVLSYIGVENRNGTEVQHIQSYQYQAGVGPQQFSTMDYYIDATTLLPVAETFTSHPDDNELVNLSVEIDYLDYQKISGVAVPIRIQRYQEGNLVLDISLSSASFNSGLSLASFAVN
jgi:hypothetical protein